MLNLDGEREAAGPSSNLLLEVGNLVDSAAGNLGLEVLELVSLLGKLALDLEAQLDAGVDVVGNLLEVLLASATGRHGRGTDTETHGGKSGLVTGSSVLIAGDVDLLEDGLDAGAVEGEGLQVEENHVVVRAVGDELVAEALEGNFEGLCVLDDLLLVELEVLGLGLLEGNGESGDGVVVGSTLVTGEDGEVNGALKIVEGLLASLCVGLAHALAEEDHGTTGSTERLVGGGGNDIAVGEGGLVDASGNETGNVSHVHEKVAADLVSDFTHTSVVDLAAVGGGTGNEDLRAVHESILLELVVINETSVEVDAVGESLEVCGDGRDPGLVSDGFLPINCPLTSSGVSGIRGSNDHREEDQDP